MCSSVLRSSSRLFRCRLVSSRSVVSVLCLLSFSNPFFRFLSCFSLLLNMFSMISMFPNVPCVFLVFSLPGFHFLFVFLTEHNMSDGTSCNVGVPDLTHFSTHGES